MLRICILILFTTIGGTEIKNENEDLSRGDFFSALGNNVMNIANAITSLKEIFKVISTDTTETSILSLLPAPEDANLNISQLIAKYRYGMEEHKVMTEDKYILSIHRLISKKNIKKNGKVVFLMHGIIDSADSWILQGPEKALGYILADEGYDVWMGNARGNRYSLTHEKLTSNDSEFWQFTWEEIGLLDLPAMIDHVLDITKKTNLFYIGHSQGTTGFYVMTSMRPEYNNKVKLMISLAPVSYISNARSPIVKLFSPAYNIIAYLFSGFNEFSPSTDTLNRISAVVCTLLPTRCDNFLYMIVGNDFKYVNKSLVPVIYGHIPAGSSLSQFIHFGQLVQSGKFRRFDFGKKGNAVIYNQTNPPDYDLKNIIVPIALYYSGNDWLSDKKDVNILKEKLPNVINETYIENFNHFDFLFASAARDTIYLKILKQLEQFEQSEQMERLTIDTLNIDSNVVQIDYMNNNTILEKPDRKR